VLLACSPDWPPDQEPPPEGKRVATEFADALVSDPDRAIALVSKDSSSASIRDVHGELGALEAEIVDGPRWVEQGVLGSANSLQFTFVGVDDIGDREGVIFVHVIPEDGGWRVYGYGFAITH
jgi:hypothetical protein